LDWRRTRKISLQPSEDAAIRQTALDYIEGWKVDGFY
jgi:hypothetical protein